MKPTILSLAFGLALFLFGRMTAQLSVSAQQEKQDQAQSTATAGWVKYAENPVLGGKLGTCFDVTLLKERDKFRMWFSWRPKKSVGLVESTDGIHWSEPVIVLGPNKQSGWEADINRPVVLHHGDSYQMWYTGQEKGRSAIGYAHSGNGKTWTRVSDKPVLSPEQPWEKVAVMCPHVLWDDQALVYRMWYSGGEQYEPNAIGYATSPNGRTWTRNEVNPIFQPDSKSPWESNRVTACQVVRHGDWHVMFYIGFRDIDHAQIGLARSKDGVTAWQRHPANPIIRPSADGWDRDAVYKPFAILDGKRWLLWYNGRRGGVEQIGLAIHGGEDLGF
jgi:beta-1,2-mannobiose phosphorylase / 1,2-beta-oligomannan phosphorylase